MPIQLTSDKNPYKGYKSHDKASDKNPYKKGYKSHYEASDRNSCQKRI